MTPQEAIEKLKTLPEDQQRVVLGRLSPDERKGIMEQLAPVPDQPGLKSLGHNKAGFPVYQGTPESAKGGRYGSDALPPEPKDWRTPLTEIQPHQPIHSVADAGREAVRALGNVGAGGLGVILRPGRTIQGMVKAAGDPLQAMTDISNQFAEAPLEATESAAGQTAALGGAGEVASETAAAVPRTAKGVARFLTRTTPKVAGELAEETRAGNEAAVTEAAEKNAKLQEKHAEQVADASEKRATNLRKFFNKTKEAEEANTAAQGKVSRKEAINRGVERLDTEVRTDLEALEKKVNAEANKKYNELRAVLKDEQADPYQAYDEQGNIQGPPVSMVEHLYDVANEPIRGTETETPIVKSLGKRTENGDVNLTYNDLQGYREEIGRELRKGTLPPDVYQSYKNLFNAVDDAMGQIAERNGLKPQQDAARAYYRQYAETFLDRDAIARKALDSKERGGVAKAYMGKDQSGIERIARFDPQVAQRLNNLRGYQGEANALPSKPGKLQSLPQLPPKPAVPPAPEPVVPEVKTIGPEDIQTAKLKSLTEKGIPGVRKAGHRIVNYGIGLHALWDAFSGRFEGLPRDIGLGAAGYGVTEAFARLLERPDIQEMLTKPTPADLQQIPPELRANMGPMLDAAKKAGIKVHPALYAVAAAPEKKRLATLLPPVK